MGLHRNNVDSLHGKLLFSQIGNVTVNNRKIKGLFQGKRHTELVFQLGQSSQQEERFSRRRLAIDGPPCWALGGNLWSREALTSVEFYKLKTMPLLCPKDEIMKYKAGFYCSIDDCLLLGRTAMIGIRSTGKVEESGVSQRKVISERKRHNLAN